MQVAGLVTMNYVFSTITCVPGTNLAAPDFIVAQEGCPKEAIVAARGRSFNIFRLNTAYS